MAASLEFETHPLDTILGGLLAHPLAAAAEVIEMYHQFTKDCSDELTAFCGLVHAPDGSGMKLCAIPLCHSGELAQAEADAGAAAQFGPPVLDLVQPMPYPAVNTMLDAGFPRGALNYWKSAFFTELTDAAVADADRRVRGGALRPWRGWSSSTSTARFAGSIRRRPRTRTVSPATTCVLTGQWSDPADTDANVAWVRDTFAALEPYIGPKVYVNYLDDDDGDRVRERLRAKPRTDSSRSSDATTRTTCSASTRTSTHHEPARTSSNRDKPRRSVPAGRTNRRSWLACGCSRWCGSQAVGSFSRSLAREPADAPWTSVAEPSAGFESSATGSARPARSWAPTSTRACSAPLGRSWRKKRSPTSTWFLDDVFDSRLEPQSFDLVHARYLIAPLGRGREQVAAHRRLVKPGGSVTLEEWDVASWHFNPPAPAADRLIRLIAEIFAGLGGNAGRGLPELLRETGIEEPEIDAHVIALKPGIPICACCSSSAPRSNCACLRS